MGGEPWESFHRLGFGEFSLKSSDPSQGNLGKESEKAEQVRTVPTKTGRSKSRNTFTILFHFFPQFNFFSKNLSN